MATWVVALTGVAHAATLNPRAVRREIARQVTATYPGLAFGNVACPDGIAKKAGTRFTCTVQLPGTFLEVDATQAGRRGTVSFETTQAVLTKQSLEEFVAANASLPATVSCGTTTWLVLRPAQQLTCRAIIADGSARDVQLTVRDSAGNVTITGVV
ncbi:MAG: DUF4333 domain-containing protein [Acidimicrobiia bacterium]